MGIKKGRGAVLEIAEVVEKERDQALARVAELEESAKLSNAVKLGEMLEASRARVAKLEAVVTASRSLRSRCRCEGDDDTST